MGILLMLILLWIASIHYSFIPYPKGDNQNFIFRDVKHCDVNSETRCWLYNNETVNVHKKFAEHYFKNKKLVWIATNAP